MKLNKKIKKLISFCKWTEESVLNPDSLITVAFNHERINEKSKYRWTGLYLMINSPFVSNMTYVNPDDFTETEGICYHIYAWCYRRALNGYNMSWKNKAICPYKTERNNG